MPGGGSGSETTSSNEPWEGQKGFLTTGYNEAQRLYQNEVP